MLFQTLPDSVSCLATAVVLRGGLAVVLDDAEGQRAEVPWNGRRTSTMPVDWRLATGALKSVLVSRC